MTVVAEAQDKGVARFSARQLPLKYLSKFHSEDAII